MKLTCPDCDTSYAVPDGAIGAEGRKVRCKSCSYVWFQEGEPDPFHESFDIFSDAVEMDINAPLPKLSQPAGYKSWVIASLAMLILAFGALFFQARAALYPLAPALYEAAGYYPNNGVVLANVSLEQLDSRRKKRYKVNCLLLNTSDTPQIQPPLAMRILSAGGKVLAEDNAYLPGGKRMIEPNDHVKCGNLEVVHNFASADKLLLEIASPIDMALRSTWSAKIGE